MDATNDEMEDFVVINYKHDFSNRGLRGHQSFEKKNFHMHYNR